jgi:hypothetical protein
MQVAHAFLWGYSYKRPKLVQLLGQLGVFLPWTLLNPTRVALLLRKPNPRQMAELLCYAAERSIGPQTPLSPVCGPPPPPPPPSRRHRPA